MKNQIFYLATALLTATLATAETSSVKGINTSDAIAASVEAEQYQSSLTENRGGERIFSPVEDKTILNPEIVITSVYGHTIEEIIAEDNKITESNVSYEGLLLFVEKPFDEIIAENKQIIECSSSFETYPLALEPTIENVIDENNHIIDNPSPEFQPLDFKAINRNTMTKKDNNKILIGMN